MSDFIAEFASFLCEHEPWQDEAACREADASLFFPDRGSSTKDAKKLCASCPVSAECEDYASRTNSQYGIWSGRLRNPGKLKAERDALAADALEPVAGFG